MTSSFGEQGLGHTESPQAPSGDPNVEQRVGCRIQGAVGHGDPVEELTQERAGARGTAKPEQQVPHDRSPIQVNDHALNVPEVNPHANSPPVPPGRPTPQPEDPRTGPGQAWAADDPAGAEPLL